MKNLYYLLVLLVCSCSFAEKIDGVTELYVVVDDTKNNASDYIEKMEVIALETNDSCLISTISKVKYINEKLYIFDRGTNSIFVFDKEGRCDTVLSKKGGGPDEYRQIADFDVTENYIVLFDPLGSIKRYNFDLEYMDEINFRRYSFEFIPKNDSLFLWNELTGSETDHYITGIHVKNNEIKDFLEMPFHSTQNRGMILGDIKAFASNKNVLYASPRLGNMIYYYANNDFHPIYKIKFDKNNFPEDENIFDYLDDYFEGNFPYIVKDHYFLSDRYLIFGYVYDYNRYFCFYDMATGQLSNGMVNVDFVDDFIFFPRWGNDNYLISAVEARDVKNEYQSLTKLNKDLENIKEDDNPVIVLYTLKSK